MIIKLIIISFYAIILGVLKAFQDKGMFYNGKCNPEKTWENKYKIPLSKNKKHWWYLGLYNPKYDEKFAYSTTLLVSLTDCWHRLETIRNILPFVILSIFVKWYLIFFYIPFIIIFHLIFSKKCGNQ